MKSQKKNNAPHPSGFPYGRSEASPAGEQMERTGATLRQRHSASMEEIQDNPPRSRGGKKVAFTLAEVLITLGIIGVVAAMTIPTLVHNYQKKVWVRQLQTTKLKLEEGFRMAMAEDGVEDLGQTELFMSLEGEDIISYDSSSKNEILKFTNNLGKYIKINATFDNNEYKIGYLNRDNFETASKSQITLMNGGTINVFIFFPNPSSENAIERGGELDKDYGAIYIDVNGLKGPNVFGRDLFVFHLAQNGRLYPRGGKDDAINRGATIKNYKNSWWYWNSPNTDMWFNCSTTKPSEGEGCTARIIEEGWKMNY